MLQREFHCLQCWFNSHPFCLVLTPCGYFIREGVDLSDGITHAAIPQAWKCWWCVLCLCVPILYVPCICPTQDLCFHVTTLWAPQVETHRPPAACVWTAGWSLSLKSTKAQKTQIKYWHDYIYLILLHYLNNWDTPCPKRSQQTNKPLNVESSS